MADPAKLPTNLFATPRRLLSDLRVGEAAYVSSRHMSVTGTGECFLTRDSKLTERGAGVIKVDRLEDGYHVTVIAKGTEWTATKVDKETVVPVASIAEDYDPSLDAEAQLARLREITRRLELDRDES